MEREHKENIRRWKDKFKVNLKEVGHKDAILFQLAHITNSCELADGTFDTLKANIPLLATKVQGERKVSFHL
jgi:hypothetical protein